MAQWVKCLHTAEGPAHNLQHPHKSWTRWLLFVSSACKAAEVWAQTGGPCSCAVTLSKRKVGRASEMAGGGVKGSRLTT